MSANNGNDAPIVLELRSDAEVLGSFYKSLKAEGIPAAVAGAIVADLYKRIRYVTPPSREPIE